MVADKESTAQATANGAAATATEALIHTEFKAMKKQQAKAMALLSVVRLHLNQVEKVQKDFSAFQKEGAAMKLFAFKANKAVNALGALTTEIRKYPKGFVVSMGTITSLSMDIYGICSGLIATVANGSFSLPNIGTSSTNSKEINLLEPQERLAFFERCLYEIDIVIFKIEQMRMEVVCSNDIQTAFLKIAPLTYVNTEFGKRIASDIVNLWKK